MQVLTQIRALGVFLVFLPYKKIHRFFSSLLHKLLSVSEVTRERKVFNKEGMQSTEVQLRWQKGGAGQTNLPLLNCTVCQVLIQNLVRVLLVLPCFL